MKIVLRADVEHLGHKGDLVDVADGYARNYLVPRGLALRATDGIQKQAESMRRNRTLKEGRDRDAATELAGRLEGRTIELKARAGEGGRLFGSVTAADIVAAVEAQTGVELDRRKLTLDEPLKELGEVAVPVRLHADVLAQLQISVVAAEPGARAPPLSTGLSPTPVGRPRRWAVRASASLAHVCAHNPHGCGRARRVVHTKDTTLFLYLPTGPECQCRVRGGKGREEIRGSFDR